MFKRQLWLRNTKQETVISGTEVSTSSSLVLAKSITLIHWKTDQIWKILRAAHNKLMYVFFLWTKIHCSYVLSVWLIDFIPFWRFIYFLFKVDKGNYIIQTLFSHNFCLKRKLELFSLHAKVCVFHALKKTCHDGNIEEPQLYFSWKC